MSDRPSPPHPDPRALVSVYDKTGLDDLVRGLHDAGVELVSTGGSAALIETLGLPVTKVEDLTGFPECLDGRVKTLHPRVHAGILADRRLESHVAQLDELGIEPFDLVVTTSTRSPRPSPPARAPDECVEQIDIGGPSMVRAAAKNHPCVAIVTSPAAYDDVLAAVAAGGFTLAQRQRLAAEAFVHTATYDVHVASWMGNVLTDTSEGTGFPAWIGATWDKAGGAALRREPAPARRALHQRLPARRSRPRAGRRSCTARRCPTTTTSTPTRPAGRRTTSTSRPSRSSSTPTRAASRSAPTSPTAHRKAHECDPVSAFGGVIATNVPVSVAMAEQVAEIFTEVIVAPGYDHGALEVLQAQEEHPAARCPPLRARRRRDARRSPAGCCCRTATRSTAEGDDPATWTLATGEAASDEALADLAFAWRACRAVKSNAILLAARRRLGRRRHGPGQPGRLLPARGRARGGAAPPARSPPPTPSSRSPTARRSCSTPACGDRAARRLGARRGDHRRREAAGVTMYFTGTRHFFH